MLVNNNEYLETIESIKQEIANARYKATASVNKELIKLRNLSSAFSRNAFVDVLNYNAYSHFNWLASKYDTLKCTTYFELLKKSYSLISKYYRCEYVYKNEGYVVNNPPLLI